MAKSITSFFDSNVSEELINQWSNFIGLPADDGLSRATAQIIFTNFALNTELQSSINTLAEVGGQWQVMNSSTITALTTTVETVGTVSTRHQEISQKLTELTVLYEQSLHSNQQLEKTLQQFQQLYQESVTQNQNLLGSLKTLTDGLLLKEELNASQSQNFQNSIVELKNILHKPWADLAASYQNLDKKLHGQSHQSPNFELKILQKFDSLRKQVENLKDQSIAPASKSLQTLQESLQLFQEIRHEMVATLSNYKVALCSLGCVSLILMGFCLAAQASSVSATSMRSSISAFGGQNYHAVALSIMDSNYRQENLDRIDRCREKNQKIKSDILECYLKIERTNFDS